MDLYETPFERLIRSVRQRLTEASVKNVSDVIVLWQELGTVYQLSEDTETGHVNVRILGKNEQS